MWEKILALIPGAFQLLRVQYLKLRNTGRSNNSKVWYLGSQCKKKRKKTTSNKWT